MIRFIICIGFIYFFPLNIFSQDYWKKENITYLRKELEKSLVNNKIQFINDDQKNDFLNCVILKITHNFPMGLNNLSKSDLVKIKLYHSDCLQTTLNIKGVEDIKNAKILLEWSDLNIRAQKAQILKQIREIGKFNDSDAERISECVVQKIIKHYPHGIDFSIIELKDYHSLILQSIKNCINLKQIP